VRCILLSPYGVDTDSLPGGTHFIEGDARLEPLSDNHKIRIIEYLDDLGRDDLSQKVRKRPIYIVPSTLGYDLVGSSDTQAESLLDIHRLALELFSGAQVAMAAFTFNGEIVEAHSFDKGDLITTAADEVRLDKTAWDNHKLYLSFLYKNLKRAPLATLVIKRLGRAMRAGPTPDGIIDLAIALEVMVQASSEIKFQFALNHALTTEDEPDKRMEAFKLLQTLYDIRSKSVHGGQMKTEDKKKLTVVKEKWKTCIGICHNSLTYYVLFCGQRPHSEWSQHLRMLALGDARVGVEE
jgi:hypothetical protein